MRTLLAAMAELASAAPPVWFARTFHIAVNVSLGMDKSKCIQYLNAYVLFVFRVGRVFLKKPGQVVRHVFENEV